jgi:hypothetical protein
LGRSERAALPDASRIEADHVVPARKLVDTLQGAELAKHLADAHARPARDEQKHALLASGVGRRRTTEPKRELDTLWTGRIDGHLEAGTLRVRHVGAGRPMQFRRRAELGPRGQRGTGERQLDPKKHQNKDD